MHRNDASRFLFLWFALATSAAAQIITTVAGTSFAFPSLPLFATNAPLGFVSAVATDAKGNVYVADFSNSLVSRITNGTLTVVAGNGVPGFSGDGGPATSAALNNPNGIAVDSAGNLYISDSINHRIREVSNGTITTIAGNGTGGFSGDGGSATSAMLTTPMGVAVDSAGNVYISDSNNHRIRKVSGGIITTFAGNGTAGFSGDGGVATSAEIKNPMGVAVDSAGGVYIADNGNYRIRKVSGGIITTIAGNGTPNYMGDGEPATGTGIGAVGVAVDSAGSVYIADGGLFIYKVSGGVIAIVAGSYPFGFSGDGGQATSAKFTEPKGVAVDSTGNVFIADYYNSRIREVSSGIIKTFAGTGKFSGDGGAAILALLNIPFGMALDSSGNLYISDTQNNRIRKVSGGIITTIAGTGAPGFSGDSGPGVSAALNLPTGITIDSAGAVYIADSNNNVVRKLSGGIITTIAGNGTAGFSGDGGSATSAELNFPFGIAVDSSGAVYISEFMGHRIRKVSGGIITTIAGNGTAGFSGDGPAANAELSSPAGLALDSPGNLYIADSGNGRIRKLSGAIIATVAGNGSSVFSGDGGPATGAGVTGPFGICVDASGSFYLSTGDGRVRKVTNGIITTIAGNGSAPGAFGGDGGPATSAQLFDPFEVAVDNTGNVYVTDSGHNRIRKVLSVPASFQVSPTTLSFSATAGSAPGTAQTVKLSPSIAGLPFSVATSASWLSVTPLSGTMPATLQVTADASQLTAGSYSASITVSAPNALPATAAISVTFSVSPAIAGSLAVSATGLPFSLTQGASPSTQQLTISNRGSGAIHYTATASTSTGGNWLSLSGTSGIVTSTSPASLGVIANPGSLPVGSYSGTVTVASPDTGQQIVVPVTLAISSPPQKILLSQAGFTFTAVAQGGTVLPQSLGILNTGSGVLNYSVQVSTQQAASGWLSVSANSGTVVRPFLDVSFVDISVDAHALSAGTYYGQVSVLASGASNSPQTALVVLTVLASGSTPPPVVRSTGLIFTGVAGNGNPGSKTVTVSNITANPTTFGSSIAYVGIGGWIDYLPTDSTVLPSAPTQITVQPDFTVLTPGAHRAALTLVFDDGSNSLVSILGVLAPPGTPSSGAAFEGEAREAGACVATELLPQFSQAGLGSSVSVGYPALISVDVVDDCGIPLTDGSVVASFSNGDPPLSLVSLQNGTWTQSWQPGVASSTVTLSAEAQLRAANLSGVAPSVTVGVQQASQAPPVLLPSSAGVFAPGDLILIKGTGLADGQASSTVSPLKSQLAGASVNIGGSSASLLYVDAEQVLALVPSDLPQNSSQQVVVQHNNAIGIPLPVIIAATHPAILTEDGSGQGQGLIFSAGPTAVAIADQSNPVKAGDSIIVYCTGLGTTDAFGKATNTPQLMIGGQAAQLSYAGVALAASYPSTGAPTVLGGLGHIGLGGLYQITATVPSGLANGAVPVSILAAAESSVSGVTIVVAGSGSTGPVITSVNTAYGSSDISQNDFIEIHGSNLSAGIAGPGVLTLQLGGTSVTVNGKPALLYYVSPTQINVLTPLDTTIGTVQIVVNNGTSSASYNANLRTVTPAFLRFDTSHVTGTHADYSLLGPPSLGSAFTPAKPGETILTYGVGFGLPAAAVTGSSPPQSGSLPTLPECQISGANAAVAFAGLNGFAGLYQLNIVIPSSAADGDNSLSCTYAGQSTAAGTQLNIQR